MPRAWGTVVSEEWKRGNPRFLVRFPNGQQFWCISEDIEFNRPMKIDLELLNFARLVKAELRKYDLLDNLTKDDLETLRDWIDDYGPVAPDLALANLEPR